MNITGDIVGAVDGCAAGIPNQSPPVSNASIFSQLIQKRKEEFYVKLQTGTTEPSYQIGGSSYTEKEWDRMLKGFDKVQEELRKEAGIDEPEKTSTAVAETEKEEQEEISEEATAALLTVESTVCTYPASDSKEKDIRYITCYQEDGIYCFQQGKSVLEWSISFTDESGYEKVMEFLNSIDTKKNPCFASHENFWKDFLEDKIDIEDFRNFLNTRVENGLPGYAMITENGTVIDKEAVKYCWYMNPPFVNRIELLNVGEGELFARNP